jgi:uncharacterized membrane protein HdeD (DUF308 family)
MRILLRCALASFVLTIVFAAWILFIPTGSKIAFALLLPSFWLTSTMFGSIFSVSDSGPANFIVLVLASSILNVVLYTAAFFLLFRLSQLIRHKHPANPSL